MTLLVEVADSALCCDLVRWAIGVSSEGGLMRWCHAMWGGADGAVGSACTLGSATVVVECGRIGITLGDGARVGVEGTLGDCAGNCSGNCRSGGCCRVEKMARRLSIASSWSSVLVGVRSACMAVVRARRQWMIRSSVVSDGSESV